MWIVCPPTFFILFSTISRRASEPKRSSKPWPHPIALAVNKSSRFLFLYARSCISKKEIRENLRTGFSFSLFPPTGKKKNKTKQNKRQENRNTQKRWGDEAQKETIRLRPSPFDECHIMMLQLMQIQYTNRSICFPGLIYCDRTWLLFFGVQITWCKICFTLGRSNFSLKSLSLCLKSQMN